MEKSFPPKWSTSVTETSETSICASFQWIRNWMKMKSSVSMGKGGKLKFFQSLQKLSVSEQRMQIHLLWCNDGSYRNCFYPIYDVIPRRPWIKRRTVTWWIVLYYSDEMSDIIWIQAFQLRLEIFRELLADNVDMADDKIDALVDIFMETIPTLLKSKL